MNSLDLRPLEPEDPRYVDLDQGDGARRGSGVSCIDELSRTIELAFVSGESRQLFTGFPGSGKTTELRRLKDRLSRALPLTHVVWIDVEVYLDPFVPPEISDLLRVLAYGLDREVVTLDGGNPDERSGYLDRLNQLIRSKLDFKGTGLDLPFVKLMVELKDNPSFREQVRHQLTGNFQQFSQEANESIRSSIERIRALSGVERVVLIVDGLEKFQPLRADDAERMERSVEQLFSQHARSLEIPCHVIYTFPFWLRWQTPSRSHGNRPVVLPMTRVRTQDGESFGAGIRLLETFVARRLDLGEVFGGHPERTLHTLIQASGGYPRDLLRLLRDLLVQARSFPVQEEDVQRVIERLREEYETVAMTGNAEVFKYILEHRQLPPGEHNLRTVGRLVQKFLVLTYRNGRDWYDLHPLVAESPRVCEWLQVPRR